MIEQLWAALVISLVATIVLEAGFLWLMGKRDLRSIVIANVLTNPAAVLLYWTARSYTDWNPILLLELLVVLTEGYYYKKLGRGFKRPYLASAAANTFSFSVGELFQYFF